MNLRRVGGRRLPVRARTHRLLACLLRHQGRVLSKSQLLESVWQYDFGGDANVVERFVSRLRRKVDTAGPPLLHTVRGFGDTVRCDRG